MNRVASAVTAGVRELRRTPVLLALLVVLPAYVVGVFAVVAPAVPATVHLPGGGTVLVSLAEGFPAFTTPMSAALVAAIAGLFLMQGSASADGRLVVAGFRPREVVLARLSLLVGVVAVATAVSVAVMASTFTPRHLGWYLVATGLTALVYGTVGVVVGLVLDRLPGIYLLLFGSMLDLFIFQNPLAAEAPTGARLLPGHFPTALAVQAGFADAVAPADLAWGLAVLGVLAAGAVLAFVRGTRSG